MESKIGVAPEGYKIAEPDHIIKAGDFLRLKNNLTWSQAHLSVGGKISCGYEVCTPIENPIPSPPSLPEGYVFLINENGPVFRKPTNGEWFVKYNYQIKKYGPIVKSKDFAVPYGCDERRYIVVPTAQPELQVPEKPNKVLIAKRTIGDFLVKGKSYEVLDYEPNSYSHKIKVGSRALFVRSDCFESEVSASDNTNVGAAVAPKKEEEVMQKETAIKAVTGVTKFVGSVGFRMANYWLFEPAANIGRPIVKSVRYAVFISTLVGAGYTYNNPEVVKNAIKSCIPKITIESPEILKG